MDTFRLAESAARTMLGQSGLGETSLAEDFLPARTEHAPVAGRRILFKGGTILTMDCDLGDFVKGDVLVEGAEIAAVAPSVEATATAVDASGMILIPGLVDAHRHSWSSAFRRAITNADGAAYSNLANSLIPALREEDVHIAAMLSDAGAIQSGITCLLDHSHMSKSSAVCDAAVQGHIDSGIRAVYSYAPPRSGPSDPAHPSDVHRLIDRFFTSGNHLITLRLGSRLISENYALARELGLGITSDGVFGVPTPLRPDASSHRLLEMAAAGELGPDVTLIHGTGFPDKVMEALRDHGVCLVLAPTSDSTLRGLGNSVPPIQQVIDYGMLERTGISVDVEVALTSDLFAQMRAIFLIQRILANKDWAEGAASAPTPMSVRDVLTMATIGGARASGLAASIGSLTPGKQADLVMIRATDINLGPLNNAVGTVVIGAGVDNVHGVMIGGRLKKWCGRLLRLDESAILRAATASRDYLAATTGLWKREDVIV